MPLPGDSEPGAEDAFVFGPGEPPEPEEAEALADLWPSLMARWIAPPEEPPSPPPADEIWGG